MNTRKRLNQASFNSLESMMEAYASHAVETAREEHSLRLEYSGASVDALESILAILSPPQDEDQEYFTRLWGGYFGEMLRRDFGEAVESLTGGEYYWMAGNFMKYGASDATFGKMTPGDIPVDSNELIALCAPRLTFISYGVPEKGDAKWLDHEGSFMATIDANRVWTLLGAKGLDIPGDLKTAKMPPVNEGHLDGKLAWRQHDGGHTDAPNMKWFIQWADKNIGFGGQ